MPIVILAKVELDDSNIEAFPKDYVEGLLQPENWNNFDREGPDGVNYAEELRTSIIEVMRIEDIEVVSVKKVMSPIPKTPDEKRAFSQEWDRRYEEGLSNDTH